MHLYLMRHGKAFERDEWEGDDRTRPLKEDGKTEVAAVAKALKKREDFGLDEILASPYVRAWQSAEIAGGVLEITVTECEEMGCGADLNALRKILAQHANHKRVLLVGHEPDLGELTGELLGTPPRPFKKAGVAYLSGDFKKGGMKLHWLWGPKELAGS